jgi:cyclin-dependent kinase
MLDIVHQEGKLYLVFEFLDMDLRRYMDDLPRNQAMDQSTIRRFMQQILSGVAYCHARRVVHRDLKPQNLLIDRSGNLKLADFGLARAFGLPVRAYTHEVVTLWYRAPEILLGSQHYSIGVDMWSVGCIFGELLKRAPLFPGDSEIEELFKIFQLLGTPDEESWPGVSVLPNYKPVFPRWMRKQLVREISPISVEAQDLLTKLLAYDPSHRLSARLALQHSYCQIKS